ncbi:hypothetical protein FRC19_001183 [Serendipita sp. 401]|nr:hypothetical protein FRC19_001183 [Serendipita sp. 401]KAG9021544.1 hypothetical protein FS842_006567 [Serendipita sp. 407]
MILSSLNEKEDSGKTLSDEEVLHQIPTFLLAGHETTSTSTTWTILSLAEHPEIQKKLRSELLTLDTESPSMEDLNSLPYLDAVVRESLRYHSVVSGTLRVASQDDVIPLEKPFMDKSGNLRDCIPISKGDTIFIPIRWFNRTTSIWGEDAKAFNPDRWKAVPKDTYAIPGVWGNQLTFLGGPRACIGYRFALVEMKALLFFLVRNFEFELAVPAEDITRRPGVVTRPAVKSELSKGNQLPMFIRAAPRDV